VLDAVTRLSALADGYPASADQRSRLLEACSYQMTKHVQDVEAMAATDLSFALLVNRGIPATPALPLGGSATTNNQAALGAVLRGRLGRGARRPEPPCGPPRHGRSVNADRSRNASRRPQPAVG
jgi:hypothetical protein